jgi:tetratricopeptide (TPR) repeat protein
MKNSSRLRYFIYLSLIIIGGCTTGKNALQKGDYDASVEKSVSRLQNSPKNSEAMQVLKMAYDLALKDHLRKIEEAKLANDLFRWESVMYDYQKINQLADDINSCPACLVIIPNPSKYISELAESKYNAAAARYNSGLGYMRENNRKAAKKAYYEFEKVINLQPDYKDVKAKLEDAYWAAVTRVVVQPILINSNTYKLSGDYFQQQIDQYIAKYSRNKFVIFYGEAQATDQKIVPDQVLSLNFDDFVVGQTYIKERVEKLERDSVVIGETRDKKPVYGTVKATLSIFEKNVSSSGLLDLSITDWKTTKLVHQQKFPGTYVWRDSWASYKGDDRALTKQQLAITKRREQLPPPPNALFLEFTKPIYNQLVEDISYYYNNY